LQKNLDVLKIKCYRIRLEEIVADHSPHSSCQEVIHPDDALVLEKQWQRAVETGSTTFL
jgi:hypothetical protein